MFAFLTTWINQWLDYKYKFNTQFISAIDIFNIHIFSLNRATLKAFEDRLYYIYLKRHFLRSILAMASCREFNRCRYRPKVWKRYLKSLRTRLNYHIFSLTKNKRTNVLRIWNYKNVSWYSSSQKVFRNKYQRRKFCFSSAFFEGLMDWWSKCVVLVLQRYWIAIEEGKEISFQYEPGYLYCSN